MKMIIRWRPELPGFDSSTRDVEGLRELFGDTETDRILAALVAAKGAPVTLTVDGPNAGFVDLDFVQAEFSVRNLSRAS
jgi:hypothetical protein